MYIPVTKYYATCNKNVIIYAICNLLNNSRLRILCENNIEFNLN